ncbi:hypothetical protein PR048_000425 [Dryococelus australis]|uniref:Uncharacterized protein n=1 Tax=Dryococelus australis TaxID=614101 RepID=A0ABQ9IEK4_9NEOP|nr:hypothetical protein PR048_000425 [Dryococelus australis]
MVEGQYGNVAEKKRDPDASAPSGKENYAYSLPPALSSHIRSSIKSIIINWNTMRLRTAFRKHYVPPLECIAPALEIALPGFAQRHIIGGHKGLVVRQLASHQSESGSITGGGSSPPPPPGFCACGNAGWQVFSANSRFPRPFIPALLRTRLSSLSSALKTSMAVVHERLQCSPPTRVNRVQFPAGSLHISAIWESCRTMPLVDGLSRRYPVSSAPLHSGAAPVSPHFVLIDSQDLVVKSRSYPKLRYAVASHIVDNALDIADKLLFLTFSCAVHKTHVCVVYKRVLNHVNQRPKGARMGLEAGYRRNVLPLRLHTNTGKSETSLFPSTSCFKGAHHFGNHFILRNILLRAAAGADTNTPHRNMRPTSLYSLPETMRSWLSRECRQRRDLLASQTSSHLLEFPIQCSGEADWRLSPPRRITQVGEDSRWRPKKIYILPQPSGRQSLTEAVWRECASEAKLWTTGRRRARCSWREWTKGCETDELRPCPLEAAELSPMAACTGIKYTGPPSGATNQINFPSKTPHFQDIAGLPITPSRDQANHNQWRSMLPNMVNRRSRHLFPLGGLTN